MITVKSIFRQRHDDRNYWFPYQDITKHMPQLTDHILILTDNILKFFCGTITINHIFTNKIITNAIYHNHCTGHYYKHDITKIIDHVININKMKLSNLFVIYNYTMPSNIRISLLTKISILNLEYDKIINELNKLKILKIKIIKEKYNECLKQLEYAEEECLGQEKLLVALSKINKYDEIIDDMITNIIMLPIQKHTFCISLCTDKIKTIQQKFEFNNVINPSIDKVYKKYYDKIYKAYIMRNFIVDMLTI